MMNILNNNKETKSYYKIRFMYYLAKYIQPLFLIGILALTYIAISTSDFRGINSDTYQAVFLSNDQVYFGKLDKSLFGSISITDVYYLRSGDNLDSTGEQSVEGSSTDSINLVKLGGEVHGPEDRIYLNKDSVVFWENLKNTSTVVKTILNSK